MKGSWRNLAAEPLPPGPLVTITVVAWIAGAAYCMGYEELVSGQGRWPSSLLWSAYGVLPWVAFVEWAKRYGEGARDIGVLIGVALAIGMLSMATEWVLDALAGDASAPVLLSVLRRLPAAGAAILIVFLLKPMAINHAKMASSQRLQTLAPLIAWAETADNYVEFHAPGRVETMRITMTEAARQLEPLGFVRVHRRYLVNAKHIAATEIDREQPVVRLSDGQAIPVGKAFRASLPA